MKPKIVIYVLVLIVFLVFSAIWLNFALTPVKLPGAITAPPALAISTLPVEKPFVRLRYPLSVIPGGVSTVEEFNMRVGQDPVLAGLACEGARIDTIPNDLIVFTTFRRGKKILWNRSPILVKKGERIIVGCGRTILMRCGNEISFTAQQPSESLPPGTLETPIVSVPSPPIFIAPPPEYSRSSYPQHGGQIVTTEIQTPPTFLGGGGQDPSSNPPSNSVAMSEPSTGLLVAAGLGVLGFLRRRAV